MKHFLYVVLSTEIDRALYLEHIMYKRGFNSMISLVQIVTLAKGPEMSLVIYYYQQQQQNKV